MMKYSLFLGSLLLFLACNTSKVKESPAAAAISSKIEMLTVVNGCPANDPLSLYVFNGIGFEKFQTPESLGQDSFLFSLPQKNPLFYYLGTEKQGKRPIILGQENGIQVSGRCGQLRGAELTNSDMNIAYDRMMNEVRAIQRDMNMLGKELRREQSSAAGAQAVVAKMAANDQKQRRYIDSIALINPYLSKVAALSFYRSFPNNKGEYKDEIEYYANEFFHYIDLSDPIYNDIPPLFESFKNFSQTLASVGLKADNLQPKIDLQLQKITPSGKAHRYALGGIVIGLQGKNHPSFAHYAKQFIDQYETSTDAKLIAGLKAQMAGAKSFAEGSVAPDFTQKTPEGKDLSLSDLRGKVVLIDFWASWCGPCRRENPNVVRVYNQYKEKGFEVLGVSLDKTKDRWVKAIEKDGLTWSHVSDLKGWQNAAAKMYSVRSIPHTVLLDQKGQIIARNLRGPQLEQQLAKIFGE